MKVSELKAEIRAEVQNELEPLRKEVQRLSNLVESSSREWKTSMKTKADAKHEHVYLGKKHWDYINEGFDLVCDNIRAIAKYLGLRVKDDGRLDV